MYEKLTLKYRPRTFDEVVGQRSIVRSMKGMLKRKKVNRTMILPGPYGSGKTSLARLIATYLNCAGRDDLEEPPCGKCAVCKRMRTRPPSFADYREINAGSTRGINDIRELISQSRFKPSARYRIFVLDEVHQLTDAAFEAVLKLLEEPPARTVFILCTTDPQKIPRTVLSRCAKHVVKPVKSEDTILLLQRIVKAEKLDREIFNDDLLAKITVVVEGNPRDSVEMLEAVINQCEGEGWFEGGEQGELNDFLLRIAETVISETPERVAARFLLGVYSGRYTAALLAVQDVDVSIPGSFVSKVIDFHQEAMFWRFSKAKLATKMMVGWHKKIEENFGEPKDDKLKPAALVQVMDLFVSMSSQLRAHAVDPGPALVNMSVKAADLMRGAG
jgi:DNA polymerase III subunit gamma/tau